MSINSSEHINDYTAPIQFHSWDEIRDFARKHNCVKLAEKLQLNNDCWSSCGEFGRSQKYLCDTIRHATTLQEQVACAKAFEKSLQNDFFGL